MLCGDRNALGEKWKELVADVRAALADRGPRAFDEGRVLAIENHQDFGSDELVDFCETTRGVGICFDTGNTFPVAEAPLDFTRRVAPHVRHVHLKDYRVQFTDEGYRLVRCAIGDGAVPLPAMLDLLAAHQPKADGRAGAGSARGAPRAAFAAGMVELLSAEGGARACRLLRRGARQSSCRRRRCSHAVGARRGRGNCGLRTQYDPPQRRQHARNWPRLGNGVRRVTKELSGKIAFVTGSGRGLGRVMAERLAELGADVAIHDISWTAPAKYGEAPDLDAVAKEIARHGGRVAAVSGNIGDKAAVAAMKAEIEAKLGTGRHPGQLRGRRHRRVGRQA